MGLRRKAFRTDRLAIHWPHNLMTVVTTSDCTGENSSCREANRAAQLRARAGARQPVLGLEQPVDEAFVVARDLLRWSEGVQAHERRVHHPRPELCVVGGNSGVDE